MAHRLLTEDPRTMGTLDLIWAMQDAYFAARTKATIDGEPAGGRLEAVTQEMQRRLERERTVSS